jgi:membrane protein implicated in regulation of membrane protease activity
MRGTVAVIGLVLAGSLGVRIALGDLSGELPALGLVLAALCLAGSILMLPWPGFAALLFALAGVLGLLAAAAKREFVGWASVALLLALVALVCAQAKRKADRHKAETDAWIRQTVSAATPDLSPRDLRR